jgi:hypothetical protein
MGSGNVDAILLTLDHNPKEGAATQSIQMSFFCREELTSTEFKALADALNQTCFATIEGLRAARPIGSKGAQDA